MPNPVVELIAQELAARVATVTVANGYNQTLSVVRPSGTARDVTPDNNRAVIFQDDPEPAEHDVPGNPPLLSFRQTFYVVVYVRPSEAEATAIDTLINRAAADVVKAVRNSVTWHSFDGNAYNAAIGATMQFEHEDEAHDGIVIPFEIWYRHPENDPYNGPRLPASGLVAHFAAASIAGVADGGNVAGWRDSAGQYDVFAPNPTAAPELLAGEINSLAAVRFATAQHDNLRRAAAVSTEPTGTLLCVLKLTQTSGAIRYLLSQGSASSDRFELVYVGAGSGSELSFRGQRSAGTLEQVTSADQVVPVGEWTVLALRTVRADNDLEIHVDGALVDTPSHASDFPWLHYPAGASTFHIGAQGGGANGSPQHDLAELALYDRELTDAELAAATEYLQTKYALD